MKSWIRAARLRTLPLALASIGMGSFLAHAYHSFDFQIFALSLLTTLLLQILSNLANDYGDAIHGADSADRKGPSRAVQSGEITRGQMRTAIFIFAFLSLLSGSYLLYVSDLSKSTLYIFLTLGLLSILAAVLYTNGKLPYGYVGLGDFFVFLFFGIVGVLGVFYLQVKTMHWDVWLPAASCGLFTVAVLNINNIRDIDSDKLAGKFSIPVRLGLRRARIYHVSLLGLGLLLSIIYVVLNFNSPTQFLFLLVVPLLFANAKSVSTKPKEELDPFLKQMAITNLVFVLTFGLSIIL